jgi:uncharacterized membrane protein YhaH (DUF805 family)
MDFARLATDYHSRSPRGQIWAFFFISLGVWIALSVIDVALLGESVLYAARGVTPGGDVLLVVLIWLAALIGMTVFGLPLGVRRLHDRDKSWTWLLVWYVSPMPLVLLAIVMGFHSGVLAALLLLAAMGMGIWAFVELYCLRGTIGPNRFGPDPLDPRGALEAAAAYGAARPSRARDAVEAPAPRPAAARPAPPPPPSEERTQRVPKAGGFEALQFRGRGDAADDDFEIPRARLKGDGVVLGRSPDDADIVLHHSQISRQHARIYLDGEQPMIEDLGATNGSEVDGKALRPNRAVAIDDGSIVRLGPLVFDVAVG